jgi:Tfp pilus assembly protein PilX
MSLIHRCQQGFTTVTLMGVLMVGGLLVAASFAAVQPDIGFTQKDEDSKQAYGAAEAGLNYYMNRLGQDNGYYTKCDQVSAPTQNAVNLEWTGTGADPRRYQKIPGYQAEYAVELLAVQTTAAGTEQCVVDVPESMVNPKTGSFRIRSTGRVRTPTSTTDKPAKRSIVATLRRKSFIDFLWFTNYETLDPAAYSPSSSFNPAWAGANCVFYRAQRNASCQDISFLSVDSLEGPLHTNDSLLICGSPTFGKDSNDLIELNGDPPGWTNSCGASPNFQGSVTYPGGILPMPQSNAELATAADDDYKFDGETTILLQGNSMSVNGGPSIPLPPTGVIYASNTSCSGGFLRQQNYAPKPGCGNIYVSGTYNKDITIGADNDIIVTDDLRSGNPSTTLGGLIANNFVRVYHPVRWTTDWRGNVDCDNDWNGPRSIQIDAAILALNHSFIADNWWCGDPLGTLTINGAVAQKFRGTVSTFSSGSTVATGYAKDYNYNRVLRYREPPYYIPPTESAWRIVRQNEQVPAR